MENKVVDLGVASGYVAENSRLSEEVGYLKEFLMGVSSSEIKRLQELEKNYRLMEYKLNQAEKEVASLKKCKAISEEEIATRINRAINRAIKETQDNMQKEIDSIKASHEKGKESSLGIRRNLKVKCARLEESKVYLEAQNKKMGKDIELLNKSLEYHKEQIEMLKDIIEKLTGLKCDTEQILDNLKCLNVSVDVESMVEQIVDKLQRGIGLSVEEIAIFKAIITSKPNRTYLEKSEHGRETEEVKRGLREIIELATREIKSVNKISTETKADIARSIGLSGNNLANALNGRLSTVKKNGTYDIIKEYIIDGNVKQETIDKCERGQLVVNILKEGE